MVLLHEITLNGNLRKSSYQAGFLNYIEPRTMDAQESLFSLKSRTFGLGQTNWEDKFLGYFWPNYQHPFW